jgi:hypothetical protein
MELHTEEDELTWITVGLGIKQRIASRQNAKGIKKEKKCGGNISKWNCENKMFRSRVIKLFPLHNTKSHLKFSMNQQNFLYGNKKKAKLEDFLTEGVSYIMCQ